MQLAWDIETTNLLNDSTVDYSASPFKLRDNFKIHCAVFQNIENGDVFEFVQEDVYKELKPWVLGNATKLIGNNTIDFDHMVLQAALGMNYTVEPDTICGKHIEIVDNMVLSKTLNPDRPAHSVDYFGSLLGSPKIDWRAKAVELGLIAHNAPAGAEFAVYHPEMLVYNRKDAEISGKIYHYLIKEWGTWDWADAYKLEKSVREIITRQSHRGFYFHSARATECVKDLDEKMEEIRQVVEPILPEKPLGKTALKQYIPTEKQFLKSGQPNTHIKNFIEKHAGTLEERDDGWYASLFGKEHKLPISSQPLVTHAAATVKDTTHIKEWLVRAFSWTPTAYKERDLTCDSKKKKLSQEKFVAAVERYVEQTLASAFCQDRCDHLGTSRARLKEKLLKHDLKKPLKVLTNPQITVGQEKEVCPNLELISDRFPHAKAISNYLTYSHRRNSILGGGVDPDDEEEEAEKGYLSAVREDRRIPTPADTCGAGTSRFKHRLCANIPRVTSLYGEQMRGLFGVDVAEGFFQIGYDFDSLEAKIEAHYTWRYDPTKEYCNSLTAEKPNDIHSVTAKKISEMIAQIFSRGNAKSVKYGASYGAQGAKIAKIVGCNLLTGQAIFDAFWAAAFPLAELKERLTQYWETKGEKKFILGIDGRKIPTRSKHALINSLFQSAGVICAKRAMVIHDKKLKEQGLAVDFWQDDWKNKSFCQQLIAYHK